jgi:hypothetical protein
MEAGEDELEKVTRILNFLKEVYQADFWNDEERQEMLNRTNQRPELTTFL